jgi:hypothetical protein
MVFHTNVFLTKLFFPGIIPIPHLLTQQPRLKFEDAPPKSPLYAVSF